MAYRQRSFGSAVYVPLSFLFLNFACTAISTSAVAPQTKRGLRDFHLEEKKQLATLVPRDARTAWLLGGGIHTPIGAALVESMVRPEEGGYGKAVVVDRSDDANAVSEFAANIFVESLPTIHPLRSESPYRESSNQALYEALTTPVMRPTEPGAEEHRFWSEHSQLFWDPQISYTAEPETSGAQNASIAVDEAVLKTRLKEEATPGFLKAIEKEKARLVADYPEHIDFHEGFARSLLGQFPTRMNDADLFAVGPDGRWLLAENREDDIWHDLELLLGENSVAYVVTDFAAQEEAIAQRIAQVPGIACRVRQHDLSKSVLALVHIGVRGFEAPVTLSSTYFYTIPVLVADTFATPALNANERLETIDEGVRYRPFPTVLEYECVKAQPQSCQQT